MKSCPFLTRSALISSCLMLGVAQAESTTDFSGVVAADASDLIFNADFDTQTNGGTTCATANALAGDMTYASDTTAAPNWMSAFGPLLSPSNDVVYVFVAGPDVLGSIVPTAANYDFAMYLIPSCAGPGSQPQPIGATATLGRGIDLASSGVISGNTYYLAITGSASGGPGANGIVTFTTPPSFAVPPR